MALVWGCGISLVILKQCSRNLYSAVMANHYSGKLLQLLLALIIMLVDVNCVFDSVAAFVPHSSVGIILWVHSDRDIEDCMYGLELSSVSCIQYLSIMIWWRNQCILWYVTVQKALLFHWHMTIWIDISTYLSVVTMYGRWLVDFSRENKIMCISGELNILKFPVLQQYQDISI